MRGPAERQSYLGERDTNSCKAQAGPQEARFASPPAGYDFRSRPRLGVAAELTAATKFLRLLFLLFLLGGIRAAQAGLVMGVTTRGGETAALSLSYNFSITSQPRPGPSCCEIQVQVNGNKFLFYACGSKEVKPVGPLGMKLKYTAFWGTQREPLKDLGEELRKKLLDIKAEILMKSENRKWTVVPPGGQQFRGTLDSDGELTKLLIGTANGDCKSWLQQVWEHWDETQETTAPPTMQPDVAQTRNICMVIVSPEVVIILVIIICIIIKNRYSVWNFLRRTGQQVHQESPDSGISSEMLPLDQLPLDEMLFIFNPPALSSLQIQKPQSNHVVQDKEPPMSLLDFGCSPDQHFPLAHSM